MTPPPPGPTSSGSAVPRAGPFTMSLAAAATFSGSTFDHNQAQGGNGNTGSGPVVLSARPGRRDRFLAFGGDAIWARTPSPSATAP